LLVRKPALAGGSRLNKNNLSSHYLWLLPPLFALWVNLDGWFLLGPITVALYVAGEWLQQQFDPIRSGEDAPAPHELRRLCYALAGGLAACLLNPHHVFAFTLPSEFAWATQDALLQEDPYFLRIYSPWQMAYFTSGAGRSVAGLAYHPLVVLGLLSFVLNRDGWRWQRVVLWVAFLTLSVYQARNAAFFSVVAGPITALNLQDFAARRFGVVPRTDRNWLAWSLGGRARTAAAVLLLLAAAWPGWLHARPNDSRQDRRVAWRVGIDPGLKAVA